VVYNVGTPYVAGVSLVRIKNIVTSVDAALGTVSFGTTLVDYTPILSSNPGVAPAVDQVFEAAGVQPVEKGVVIARPDEGAAVGCHNSDGRM
jgi:hypothetical protein